MAEEDHGMEGFHLGTKDAVELRLIEDFRAGRRTRAEVALLLGVSERAVTRRAAKVREQGARGVKHGNYQRRPVNCLPDGERLRALELAATTYAAFNLSHCHERLKAEHGVLCSYETFRTWCQAAGLGRRRRRRPSKARIARERMANEGLMLQLDGSPHRWNGRDEWCLVAAIDDATSTMTAARFFPSETTWACLNVLRSVIERHGIPEILYTDQAGWAGGGEKRRYFSQFVRAGEELGITIVTTSSPEAKGRIERAFRTIQDRLVPELALAGVARMVDANRYLEQVFLPSYWNTRLTVEARSATKRWRALPPGLDLSQVLCFKYRRRLARNHTIQLHGVNYRVRNPELGSLAGKEVTAHVDEAGTLTWYYGHIPLNAEVLEQPKRRWDRDAS
jgi:hypothetical protein